MTVAIKAYSNFPHLLLEDGLAGSILDQTIRVALCTSSYTPNQDTHDYFDDITNELTTGDGYTAEGAALASKTCTMTTRVTTFDAADTSWSEATITARYAIIYYDSGTPGTSLLIAYVDFGEDKSSENGTFQLTWNASGIFTITVPA
jgi:hypothetical protein